MKSIYDTPGQVMNPLTTWEQIGIPAQMRTGTQVKTKVYGRDFVKAKVSGKYWLTVKLNPNDYYDLEVATVRKVKGMLTYKVIEQAFDIPAADLAYHYTKLGDRA
jgi:hypothetical protein